MEVFTNRRTRGRYRREDYKTFSLFYYTNITVTLQDPVSVRHRNLIGGYI